jgi:hypothetical protein
MSCSAQKMRECAALHSSFLERSNPTLRRNSEFFLEIIRFIWNANPNYDVYREFSKRHLLVPYKVHELISARLKIEKREQQSALLDQRTEPRRQRQGGFFARLFRRRSASKAIDALGPIIRIASPLHQDRNPPEWPPDL